MKNFRCYEKNVSGRDFVVGDIHGAYDMVIAGMRIAKFDRNVDRIFSVGDLIDRGPGSHRALEFLSQPYVHAIRGNHDDDFSTLSLKDMRTLGSVNFNGLGWVNSVADEKLLAIKQKLSELPIAMQVETDRGTVGFVHGDVPSNMTWQDFIAALEAGNEGAISIALTGRDRISGRDDSGVPGVGRVFVGHTIQWSGPRKLGNVYAVDTGACFREIRADEQRGSLTMASLLCQTGSLINRPQERPAVEVISDEHSASPFGQYAKPVTP